MKNKEQQDIFVDELADFKDVAAQSTSMLESVTKQLRISRNFVASPSQIIEAISRFPRILERIPQEHRTETLCRACVAVLAGLFDAAINYIWNAAILLLRDKVRAFGLNVIPQILDDTSFDEASLLDLKDAELLDLCLKLNLLTDHDFFFLDQCRTTRNAYSIAHPSEPMLDEDEVVNFLSRVQKHALSNRSNPKGVDIKAMLDSLQKDTFSEDQKQEWISRILGTFEAQRILILGTLHGIYCDPSSREEARVNVISICTELAREISPSAKSQLIDRHQDYRAKGDNKRQLASQKFFEKIDMLSLLNSAELHSLVTKASKALLRVHNDWDNFHNEPPFANRLYEITKSIEVPESAMHVFVETVITCAIGNQYGVSNGANSYYIRLIRSFSMKATTIMMNLPTQSDVIKRRLSHFSNCRAKFQEVVSILDESTVPVEVQKEYSQWKKLDDTVETIRPNF